MRRAGALSIVAAAVRAPSLIAQVHGSRVAATPTKTGTFPGQRERNAPAATDLATTWVSFYSQAPLLEVQQRNDLVPCSKADAWWKEDVMAVYNYLKQANGTCVDKDSFLARLWGNPCNVQEVPTNSVVAFPWSLFSSDMREFLQRNWRFTYNGGRTSLLIGRIHTLDQHHHLLGDNEWLIVKNKLIQTVGRLYASSFTYPLIRGSNVAVWGRQGAIRACLLPAADMHRPVEKGAPSLNEQKEAIEKLVCYSVSSNEDVVEPEPKAKGIHRHFMTIYENIKRTNGGRVPVAEFVAQVRAEHPVHFHVVSEHVYRTFLESLPPSSLNKISSSINGFGYQGNFHAYQAMEDMKEFFTQKVFTCKIGWENPADRGVLLLIDKHTTLSKFKNLSAIDCVAVWTKVDALLTRMVNGYLQSKSVIVWRDKGTIKVGLLPQPFSRPRLVTDVFQFREQHYATVLFLSSLGTAKGGQQLYRQLRQLATQTELLRRLAPPPEQPTSLAELFMVPQAGQVQQGWCPPPSSWEPPAGLVQQGWCPPPSSWEPQADLVQQGWCPPPSSWEPPADLVQQGWCPRWCPPPAVRTAKSATTTVRGEIRSPVCGHSAKFSAEFGGPSAMPHNPKPQKVPPRQSTP